MDNKEIEMLSKYRLEQSKENLEEAEVLFNISCNKGNTSIGTNRF